MRAAAKGSFASCQPGSSAPAHCIEKSLFFRLQSDAVKVQPASDLDKA